MFLEALDNSTRAAMFGGSDDRLALNSLDTATTTIPTIETNHIALAPPASGEHSSPMNSNYPPHTLQALPCFNDLIAVLIECFSLIAIGYLSGRFRLISPDAKDLGAYLTTFALPMIIFLNVAQMEIQTINLSFLVCMLISKLVIFLLVSLVTLAISYPSNFSYAGALSILSTQSNDFALGYPLFKSLYGESKPEMLNYLNLMGPIQLLIINPLGIVMLEFGKSQLKRRQRRERLAREAKLSPKTAGRRCSHCQNQSHTLAVTVDDPYAKQYAESPVANGQPEQSTSGERDDQTTLKRKNCKSLVLVMPGRLVQDCSLSSASINSLECDQQVASRAKSLSPNLLGDLSSVGDLPQTPQSLDTPPRRSWLAATSMNQIGAQSFDAASETGCTCWQNKPIDFEESMVDLGFLWALMTNPLIIMSLLALAVNLLNGPVLPKFVTKVSNTIAASFAAPALLVVGLSMYGKFKLILRNPNDLLLASVLVMTKVMVLPNIMRTVMQMTLPHYVEAAEIPNLVDFSYLYGLLPTAPGACIIAKQYEILTNVVSISMLLSTFISAPLMLGTSVVISKAASITPQSIVHIMGRVLKISSSLTITLGLLTLYLLWRSNKDSVRARGSLLMDAAIHKSRHLFAVLLTLTQVLIGIGGFLWLFVEPSKSKQVFSAAFNEKLPQEEDALAVDWSHRAKSLTEDDEDLLAHQEERLHFLESNAHASVSSGGSFYSLSAIACTASFMQASGGLMLAKFLILCIVVTNFARYSRGHQIASQVSWLMTKVLPMLTATIVMCLFFESKHLTCQPTEASLPRWSFSLYLRLVFNALVLGLALLLFVATLRLKNKQAQRRLEDLTEVSVNGLRHGAATHGANTNTLTKKQFIASSVSISSGTSSEMTTSTNLDALNQAHLVQSCSKDPAMTQRPSLASITSTNQQVADAANLLIDYGRLYQHKFEPEAGRAKTENLTPDQRIAQQTFYDLNNNNGDAAAAHSDELMGATNLNGPATVFATIFQADDNLSKVTEPISSAHHHPNDVGPPSSFTPKPRTRTSNVEFDRNSILVVFMLFQTILSVTSILQILFQGNHSSGPTFVMVELTNLVVDLGQGLVTFLVLGTQALSLRWHFATRSTGTTSQTANVPVGA